MFWFSTPKPDAKKIEKLKKCLKTARATFKRIIAHNKRININQKDCEKKHCGTLKQKSGRLYTATWEKAKKECAGSNACYFRTQARLLRAPRVITARREYRECQLKHCRKTAKRDDGRRIKRPGPDTRCKNYYELKQYL